MLLSLLLAATVAADPVCAPQRAVAGRPSKYDSTMAKVGAASVKICYSRPLVKGRAIFGSSMVPYDKLWRTGANEPTIIHTTAPITVAGVRLDAGSYSLYSVPVKDGPWEIVLNKSVTQWGHEGQYDGVKAQEIARGKAPSSSLSTLVEAFTIELSPSTITMSWEKTKVAIPIAPAR